MADTMTIAGKHVPKPVVYGGIGVLVVGGVLWYRSRTAATASAATTAAGSGSTVDPATGLTYDAETAAYGSPAAAEAAVSAGYGATAGTGYSGLGYGFPTTGAGSVTTPAGNGYVSNAQWAQAVEQGMTGLGYNSASVGSAIGKYLLALPLASDQLTIVQTAVGLYGPPPVGTFAIISAPTGSGSTGTGTPPKPPAAAPAGFSVTPHAGGADVGFGTVAGATGYEIVITGAGGAGTGTSHVDQHQAGTHAKVTLVPGRYTAHARAVNSAGSGPWSASHTFTVLSVAK